eukprot:s612_g29.t1
MPAQEVQGQSSQEDGFSRVSSTATLEVSPKALPQSPRPMSRPLSPAVEAKLKECFDEISKRSGMIDLNAYKQVMRKLQVPLDDDQIERVFESVDRNKDGRLSFDEYAKLVMLGMIILQQLEPTMLRSIKAETESFKPIAKGFAR